MDEATVAKLGKYQEIIRESNILTKTFELIDKFNEEQIAFKRIRCLALGSPVETKIALFQLAYLVEIQREYSVEPENVSLYDPVFNKDDERLLKEHLGYEIDETYDIEEACIKETIFFLPHAGLDITDCLIEETKPQWIIGNDLISHTERLSKQKLYETYRNLAYLVKLIEESNHNQIDDGFTSVKPKSKKNRKNKYVFKEPELIYDFSKVYFDKVLHEKLPSDDGVWGNAFTDLTVHYINSKTEQNQIDDLEQGLHQLKV